MKENDVIWASIEESDKDEPFDKNRYALRKDNMGVFKFIVINDKIE